MKQFMVPSLYEYNGTKCTRNIVYNVLKLDSNNLVSTEAYYLIFYFFLLFGLWGYWHCGHSWPIVPASGDNEDDYGEADGM
jgi:hypothetical protein